MSDQIFGIDAATWQAIEAIGVVFGATIAGFGLVGLVLAVIQLRIQNRARNAQAFVQVMQQLTDVATPEIRLWLESQDSRSLHEITVEDRVKLIAIVYAFNRIGLMMERRLISRDLVLTLIGEVAVDYWELLWPYIRERKREWIRTGRHYRLLCVEAKKWMATNAYLKEVTSEYEYVMRRLKDPVRK